MTIQEQPRGAYEPSAAEFRYYVLVGADWRILLRAEDRYTLRYIMEQELHNVTTNLVDAFRTAATCPVGSFYLEVPAILARRAHRYARILEVLS